MLKKILFLGICASINFCNLNAQDIVINEFMASNDSLTMILDEFDESDDWVELYNTTNATIDLTGYYFSDDYLEPEKWVFPDGVSIPANGYLVVWTDNDDEQGDLHTNFKLKKEGEELMLSTPDLMLLDSISFGEQETNISMSRIPNGTGPFIQQAATFNANNDNEVATVLPEIFETVSLNPNPAHHFAQLEFQLKERPEVIAVTIYNTIGKRLHFQQINPNSSFEKVLLPTIELISGLYFVELRADDHRVTYPLSIQH